MILFIQSIIRRTFSLPILEAVEINESARYYKIHDTQGNLKALLRQSALNAHRRLDLFAQETAADFNETVRRIGNKKTVRPFAVFSDDRSLFQHRRDHLGGFVGGIDKAYARAHELANGFLQQWIVRAAENQRVDTALLETLKIGFSRHLDDFVIRPTFFDQRHEEWTGAAVNLDGAVRGLESVSISAALNRCLGADHAHLFIFRALDRAPHAGLDHADHRDRQALSQLAQGDGRRSVACDNHDLDTLFNEKFAVLVGIAQHGLDGFRAVGRARRITEIDRIFPRQRLDNLMQHLETADAGIKHADGAVLVRHENVKRAAPFDYRALFRRPAQSRRPAARLRATPCKHKS